MKTEKQNQYVERCRQYLSTLLEPTDDDGVEPIYKLKRIPNDAYEFLRFSQDGQFFHLMNFRLNSKACSLLS